MMMCSGTAAVGSVWSLFLFIMAWAGLDWTDFGDELSSAEFTLLDLERESGKS